MMRFNYRSEAIGGYVDISIVYPTDNYSYYDEAQGIRNSFGADTNYGISYATFLTEELPVVMQTLFASSPKREDNFIMGYAMGGNAALGTALRRPDLYHTCVDISGGIGYTLNTKTLQEELDGEHFRTSFPLHNATFGASADLPGSRHDMYTIAKKHLEAGDTLTNFYLISGSEEGFIRARIEADAATLKELGYPVTYICAEGYHHDFNMWNDYLEIAMDSLLPLQRRKPVI